LARRNVAESAVTEASDALTTALDELQRLGFDLNQVAEILDVDAAELSGPGYNRRVSGRNTRPGRVPEPTQFEDVQEPEPSE
jgi:hypothetical protein